MPKLRNKKKPCKPMFTGHGGQCGGGSGMGQLPVWPLGCVVDVEWWSRCCVAREHENVKKSCKCQFTVLVFVAEAYHGSL